MKAIPSFGTNIFVRCPEKQDVRLIKVILYCFIQRLGRDIGFCLFRGDVRLTKRPFKQESTVYIFIYIYIYIYIIYIYNYIHRDVFML